MQKIKHTWNNLSLKRKILVITMFVVILTGSSILFSVTVMKAILNKYEANLYQNFICYELQEALQNETEKFLAYTRDFSVQSNEEMLAAFAYTEECIEKLPFDFEDIGKERYAVTWNIRNGYDGYKTYRDQVLLMSEKDPDYITELYRVFDMQEDLSHYALRLVEATLEQGNLDYETMRPFFKTLPFMWFNMLAISVAFLLLLFYGFTKDLASPLIEMAKESRKMAAGNFLGSDLKTERKDEVGELVHAFNKMRLATRDFIETSESLHEEKMKNLEKEKRLEGARLEILKSQVNPHFLFNTLNMISCMAKMEEADVTDRMIISLSNLFRYNLRTTEQEVYLEQELEALDDYIYIQQMRFDNRIVYNKHIEVDESVVMIPSFTLQPIVENAFVHGLSHEEEGGRVELHVWLEGHDLMIRIADDGCGMSEEKLEEVRRGLGKQENSGRGIGIGNISRRVHMLYGDGKFDIESQEGVGTVVTITIPQEVVKGEVDRV